MVIKGTYYRLGPSEPFLRFVEKNWDKDLCSFEIVASTDYVVVCSYLLWLPKSCLPNEANRGKHELETVKKEQEKGASFKSSARKQIFFISPKTLKLYTWDLLEIPGNEFPILRPKEVKWVKMCYILWTLLAAWWSLQWVGGNGTVYVLKHMESV